MENKHTALAPLHRLIGEWRTEGTVFSAEGKPEMTVKGTDTYQWLPGDYFVLHIADVLMGDNKSYTHEIIGHDAKAGDFTMQYFNNAGESGMMTATVKDEQWEILGDALRFRGGFSENDTVFSGIWERLEAGKNWVLFIKIRLVKK